MVDKKGSKTLDKHKQEWDDANTERRSAINKAGSSRLMSEKIVPTKQRQDDEWDLGGGRNRTRQSH